MLVFIKLLHTAIWFFFAACIFAMPVAGMLRRLKLASGLIAIVLVECLILALNHLRCPLTDLAAGYTEDRGSNFDIYLPAWLAQHNQAIFGVLFLAGVLLVLWKWRHPQGSVTPG